MTYSRIGLALSGGGFRAACFGLGCLRALYDEDLLRNVSVISGVSGGSLLAALYAYGPSNFDEFDALVVEQLRRGFQLEIAARALNPRRAISKLSFDTRCAVFRRSTEQFVQSVNRADALRDTLASRVFGERSLSDVTHADLATVITATDLRTSNAVRFGSLRSSCSAYGTIQETIGVADAVAASGAFPTLLPGIERIFTFQREASGVMERHKVVLSDGGIYDNLGSSVLEPKRSSLHTPHVYDVEYIVSSDAGRGRLPIIQGRFAPSRLKRSFDTTYRRSQDASRSHLHDAVNSGQLKGVVHSYLGMPDSRLPVPVSDLVLAEEVNEYPTDFRAMSSSQIDAISLRGEQLTHTLLAHYCPDLGPR